MGNDTLADLAGRYVHVSSEKMDDLMEKMGVDPMKRQVQKATSLTFEIVDHGNGVFTKHDIMDSNDRHQLLEESVKSFELM